MMITRCSDTNRHCHSDDDPELAEGEEEESVVAEAAKKQIPFDCSERAVVESHPGAKNAQEWGTQLFKKSQALRAGSCAQSGRFDGKTTCLGLTAP